MSKTAKSGFIIKDQVVHEFNNWKKSKHVQKWLSSMGYENVGMVEAIDTRSLGKNTKADVIVTINNKKVGISVKKFTASFNQIDKRRVDKYAKMWHIPKEITDTLRKYCGGMGFRPIDYGEMTRDSRRYFLNELKCKKVDALIKNFCEK